MAGLSALVRDLKGSLIPHTDCVEAALIAGAGNELAQNIVCGVSLRAAFVYRIDHEVGGRQRGDGNTLAMARRLIFARSGGGTRPAGAGHTSSAWTTFQPIFLRPSPDRGQEVCGGNANG
jgi:hypothetical protein